MKFQKGHKPWNQGLEGQQVAWNKGLPREMQPNYGKTLSHEQRLKIGFANKGKLKERGEKHHLWKGEKVGLSALHSWVKKYKLKSDVCEFCKQKKPLDLANISHQYKRDINDFKWLCKKCHLNYDGVLNVLLKASENSRFKKGRIPWNKDKRGLQIAWNKGLTKKKNEN